MRECRDDWEPDEELAERNGNRSRMMKGLRKGKGKGKGDLIFWRW